MGYFSNVLIAFTEGSYKKFKSKVSAIKNPEKKSRLHTFLSNAEILMHNKSHDVIMTWLEVEWYSCDSELYPEMFFIDQFLNTLPMQEYHFVRNGEELNDIEVYGTLQSRFKETVTLKISYRKNNSTAIGFD